MLLEEFKKQLPKPYRWRGIELINFIGSMCSISAVLVAIFFLKPSTAVIVNNIALILLVFFLIGFTIIREFSKSHRYSQTVYYQHFVNHVLRNFFCELKNNANPDICELTSDILTTISQCFSMVTGKPCRACLKEIKPDLDLTIVTAERCLHSRETQSRNDQKTTHPLAENTDFYNLWYATKGCVRYYICNDLIKAWKKREYKNSSFKVLGDPKVCEPLLNFTFARNCNLPYRSTIVLPIRYLKKFEPPELNSNTVPSDWDFWGFLCIDSNSRNVFDSRLAPELGLAFADLLHLLFSETNEIVKRKKKAQPQ